MIRVGVVGLGRMGSGMALNVAKAGFPLSVYDTQEGRTQELRESWVKDKHLPTGTECSTGMAIVSVLHLYSLHLVHISHLKISHLKKVLELP